MFSGLGRTTCECWGLVGPGEEIGKEGKVYKDKSNAQAKEEKCAHDRVKEC